MIHHFNWDEINGGQIIFATRDKQPECRSRKTPKNPLLLRSNFKNYKMVFRDAKNIWTRVPGRSLTSSMHIRYKRRDKEQKYKWKKCLLSRIFSLNLKMLISCNGNLITSMMLLNGRKFYAEIPLFCCCPCQLNLCTGNINGCCKCTLDTWWRRKLPSFQWRQKGILEYWWSDIARQITLFKSPCCWTNFFSIESCVCVSFSFQCFNNITFGRVFSLHYTFKDWKWDVAERRIEGE